MSKREFALIKIHLIGNFILVILSHKWTDSIDKKVINIQLISYIDIIYMCVFVGEEREHSVKIRYDKPFL